MSLGHLSSCPKPGQHQEETPLSTITNKAPVLDAFAPGQGRIQHLGAAWRDKFLIACCSSIKNHNAQLRDDPALQSRSPYGVHDMDIGVCNMKIISISQELHALHPEIQGNHQIHFQGNSPRKTSLPDSCYCSINSFHSATL